ncbi:Cuticle protein 7 [Papilio xuthus]|uniref:Cuticle protein 7 n=1 Tax=Papilio xuthus TaxID=66420 RepID=A0A194PVA0_PAPXU|nr:Cuticle protein 7 [Papilio xuthus]
MVHQLIILSCLIMSATCMVLHQAVPLYVPIQYQEPTRNYDFAYEVNDAHTGDYKRQQETRIGDTVLGHYSLLQPDGITRTVQYRADEGTGFNAVVNNAGRPIPERQEEALREESERRGNEQQEQFRQTSGQQTVRPLTVENTALIHHVLRQYRHAH